MDNENGTTLVKDVKSVEEVTTKPTDAIDSVSIEATESVKVKPSNEIVESMNNSDETKKMNSSESVNKTTTTVTVNVTQTKVTIDDANTKKDTAAGVVTTVAYIAEAAIDAVEKIEQSAQKTAQIEATNTGSDNDIEMPEVNNDIEMKDITSAEKFQTNNAIDAKPKTAEADSVNDSNEAEQKIDDVEKNISNLFNGDDNVVSTNTQTFDDSVKAEPKTGRSSDETLNNGSDGKSKESTSDDVIKDNNDLVSILAGNDRADDKISSSQKDAVPAPELSSSKNASVKCEPKLIENKLLKNISTPSSSTSTANVYNSTPIQKQFDISAENVSNISESAIDTEHILGDKSTRQEIISSHSSTLDEKSTDLSSSAAVTGSETEQTSSDNLTRFANAVRTLNGTSDETDTSTGKCDPIPSKIEKSNIIAAPSKSITSTVSTTSENPVYDVNFCYDNKELVYFSVERLEQNKSQPISDQSSSIGSVNSVHETFALPARCAAVTSTNSTLSSSSSELGVSSATNNIEKSKQEVKGTLAMCQYIIDHFTKIKAQYKGPEIEETVKSNETTPVSTGRRRGANATPTTPSIQESGSKRKRGNARASPIEIDADDQPKSAKKAKKVVEPSSPITPNYPEKAVLARWVDKKFYAGRVFEQRPNNKFVVLFEDGAKKVLPEEYIVFGDQNMLPLLNESVHALVKEDTYEPGIVEKVDTKDDGIYYTVSCESTIVTVTASDIYLEDDQAKAILSKRASNFPEPGYSGGINTRKDRRQKRNTIGRAV